MITYFNNFYDSSASQAFGQVYNFNPIDKIVELYERLVEAEREKNVYLEKLLDIQKRH